MAKGPLDRLEELRQKERELKARIAEGKSGDGKTSPDLNAQLQTVSQERRTLESANPARRMYPSMKK